MFCAPKDTFACTSQTHAQQKQKGVENQAELLMCITQLYIRLTSTYITSHLIRPLNTYLNSVASELKFLIQLNLCLQHKNISSVCLLK